MAILTQAGITFSDETSQTSAAGFPAGTLMLFQQTAAPTGWTKQTTHNNKALRIVSGTAGSGGSIDFTTAFASGLSAGATTLSIAQIPSHTHDYSRSNNSNYQVTCCASMYANQGVATVASAATGGGGSHTHTLPSFAVQYVDIIIASKN